MANRLVLAKKQLVNDSLVRQSTLLVGFSAISMLFNFVYQLSMGQMLSARDYGVLVSLLSIFVIAQALSDTIQISMTKFTSRFQALGKPGAVHHIWRFSLKRTLFMGVALALVLGLFSPLLYRFLHINNPWIVVATLASLILVFALPVNYGVLRGLARFLPLGFSSAMWALTKLLVGFILVFVGLGVSGALLALVAANVIIFFITSTFLKDVSWATEETGDIGGLLSYAGLTLLAVTCFTILVNSDVLLSTHYLGLVEGGNYAALSVIGKVAFYAPSGIFIVLFPKTSELFELKREHRPLFIKAMFMTSFIGIVLLAIFGIFPTFVVEILFRGKYLPVAPNLFAYGLAMLLFSFSFLMLNYLLSINRTRVAYPLIGVVLMMFILIYLFHSSIAQIVNVLIATSAASLILMFSFYLRGSRV